MKITKSDREDFPYHTDDSIIGIKIIRELTDDQLIDIWKMTDDGKVFIDLLKQQLGEDTNPRWVSEEIITELENRGLKNEPRR